MSLYEELSRRKVFKSLGVYAGVAFVTMQLAADLFPYLYLPDWTVTLIIILAILGFPITFLLSWKYDIKKDDSNSGANQIKIEKYLTRKVFFTATGFILMIIGAAFWFIYPFISLGIADDRNYDASIAILYMDNISSEEQSYFSDGLTIELINRLSRIENLKVSPRIDVAVFKDSPSSISEMAKKLEVDYIVDGSVKIFDKNLRVNISLFDMNSNEVIWTDEYNDKLIDILKVQDLIATKVVSKLSRKLNITEIDLLATSKKATENLEAYNLIQKSYQFFKEPITLNKVGEAIEPLAEKAIELDSTYSEAYAIAALGKRFKWWIPNKKAIVQEKADKEKALEYIDLAIKYNNKNRIAKAMKVLMPQWNIGEVSNANQIFAARSTMIDAKMLIQEFPNDLFCKSMYVYFSHEMGKILGLDEEDIKQQLSDLLFVYNKLEKIDFKYNEITEIMASMIAFEHIPKLYAELNEPENMIDFIKNNKNNFCQDGTYECLTIYMLKMISEGYYTGYDYEESLKVINSILSINEDELVALGFGLGDLRRSYYRHAMMNMKLGNYNLAIKGFKTALSLVGEQAICEPCEFNFSEREEEQRDNEWWQGQYNRRLGLANTLKGDYSEASKYYSQALELNQDNEKSLIKSSCSYGYVQALANNNDISMQNIKECEEWVANNYLSIDDSYDAYETIWPLYLYYSDFNSEKANKYLSLTYDYIDTDEMEEYKNSSNKERMGPKFFYYRDVIEAYENNIIQ